MIFSLYVSGYLSADVDL
uniref:Uncharacterized protein n=1 Tax=Anguilla anguilla TaxID=7936 RepID=A0A0E9PGZ3_ANGAN